VKGSGICAQCGGPRDLGLTHPFCSVLCRFESKVVRHAPGTDGCDLWVGTEAKKGYGAFSMSHAKPLPAHRAAWILANGPVPDGLQVGHACHDAAALRGGCSGGVMCPHRRCVRLDHLVLQTSRENSLATPLSRARRNRAVAVCPAGHDITDPDNRMSRVRDGRIHVECGVCSRERGLERNRLISEASKVVGLSYDAYVAEYGYGAAAARRILGR
jgi:hypothetical protein